MCDCACPVAIGQMRREACALRSVVNRSASSFYLICLSFMFSMFCLFCPHSSLSAIRLERSSARTCSCVPTRSLFPTPTEPPVLWYAYRNGEQQRETRLLLLHSLPTCSRTRHSYSRCCSCSPQCTPTLRAPLFFPSPLRRLTVCSLPFRRHVAIDADNCFSSLLLLADY